MARLVRCASELPPSLPPLDAWKVDPYTLDKFFVPTDDRKFVLPDAAIETILSLFEEDYRWPIDWSKDASQILKPDDHHFHWKAANYKEQLFSGGRASVPARFRELPTNRGILPRQFHNVIHKFTLPPAMPKTEDMLRYLESFEIASQLFRTAELALQIDGHFDLARTEVGLERCMERWVDTFKAYSETVCKMQGAQLAEIIGDAKLNVDSLPDIVEQLGSCALINTPNYTVRYFCPEMTLAG